MSHIRGELGKCNATEKHDWNARIYGIVNNLNPNFLCQLGESIDYFKMKLTYIYSFSFQQWQREKASNFENSKLENQCTFR